MIKIVGKRNLNFTNDNGQEIRGNQYAYLFEDPHIDGYWIDKFFVNENSKVPCEIVVGRNYDVNCYFRSNRLDLSTLKMIP